MRAILHFDADAFFASVEQAVDRRLRGRPIAVGALHRGIVCSASYEARRLGIYTPMPVSQAQRSCPQLIVIPPHFELYEQFSNNIFGLAGEMTPIIEKQGADEGYLDLTGTRGGWDADPLAVTQRFQRTVQDWLKVTISQGLARNKLLSQIASKLYKPNGLTIIPPERSRELEFLHPLPAKWLPGVGAKCEQRLRLAGLNCIGQVASASLDRLAAVVGSLAWQLHDFAWNIDERAVVTTRADALSYGHQETFDEDTTDTAFVYAKLCQLADHAFVRLREDRKQIRTVTVKLRDARMNERQGQLSLDEPTDVETQVYPLLKRLLERLWNGRVRLRMAQVKLSKVYSGFGQLDLFGQKQKQHELAVTCQKVRERFGWQAMMRWHDWQLKIQESASYPF